MLVGDHGRIAMPKHITQRDGMNAARGALTPQPLERGVIKGTGLNEASEGGDMKIR